MVAALALAGSVAVFVAMLGVTYGFRGVPTSTVNWQTSSPVSFTFQVTPKLAALGVLLAQALGFAGGLPSVIRAARWPVAQVLRQR